MTSRSLVPRLEREASTLLAAADGCLAHAVAALLSVDDRRATRALHYELRRMSRGREAVRVVLGRAIAAMDPVHDAARELGIPTARCHVPTCSTRDVVLETRVRGKGRA